jgi:GAF domain-containing protein
MDLQAQNRFVNPGTLSVGVALCVALVVHLWLPFLALSWSHQPFIGVLLEHNLIVQVSDSRWTAPSVAWEPGGRLIAVNGQPVSARQDLESILDPFAVGDHIALTFEQIHKEQRETHQVDITLGTFGPGDLIAHFAVPYLVGLCYLGIGIWSFWGHLNRRQGLAFPALCAVASVLISATFDALTTHTLVRLWLAAWPLTALALLCLALDFSYRVGQNAVKTRWVWLPAALVTATIVWSQISFYAPGPRAPWIAQISLLAISIIAFIGILIDTRLHPSYVWMRLRAQAILVAIAVSLFPLATWAGTWALQFVLPAIHIHSPYEPLLCFPPLIFFPIAVQYASRHYRSRDVNLLLAPTYYGRHDHPAALRNFSRALAGSLDLDYILDQLLSFVEMAFSPKHTLVFMLSGTGDDYELHTWRGQVDEQALHSARLTVHDSTIARLQQDGESLLLSPMESDLQIEEHEYDCLRRLNIVLLVPLRPQDHLLGLLAMGPIRSGDLYAGDDIALLTTVANQAAIAVENALLYVQQVEQEQRLIQQTRRLRDILALGNRLKALDRELVVQSTVQAVQQSQGFDLVTLSLVEEDDPTRARVVAWTGTDSKTWESLASQSFPLIDFDVIAGVQQVSHSFFIHAPGTTPDISTPQNRLHWHDGDQLFVPLTTDEELLGYLIVDSPRDELRPTDDTIEVLEIFANQAAIAIQNANLYASLDRALDERVAELATLHEIDRQINAKLDFDHVMDTTLEWAIQLTSATAGTLALLSEDKQELNIVAHRGYPDEMAKYWNTPWSTQEGIIGRVIHSGEPVLKDVSKDAHSDDMMLLSTSAHLATPIMREHQVVGVISLESTEPDGFTAAHLASLMRLADHAAIAIENATLYEQTNRRIAELFTIQQISLDLTSSLDLDAVLDSIAINTRSLTMADHITIYLYDQARDTLSFGTGLSKTGKEQPPIPIHRNELSATVARQGQPIVIHDVQQHTLFADMEWQHVKAIASIPLRKSDRVLGIFDVAFYAPHNFSQDELRLLNLLADQAAIAIENAQLYADIQRADEAKSEIVDVISHELRAPMTSIQGYARLIALGSSQEQSQEFAHIILRNVERMSRQVSQLLDLSRIESGRLQLAPRTFDLARAVHTARHAVENDFKDKKPQIKVDIPTDLNVYADPERVIQAWSHLLGTAVKQAPEKSQIEAWARPYAGREIHTDDKEYVLCTVRDAAHGMPHHEPEHTVDPVGKTPISQIGSDQKIDLGLSIARGIIELHGGQIWQESQPDWGSTFYFTLPHARAVQNGSVESNSHGNTGT